MTIGVDDQDVLEALDERLSILLPEDYQQTYEQLEPKPMRSAALKYDAWGRVAWDEIWGSFCDLAMAGGPPHKGALLEPGSRDEVSAWPERYGQVTSEICRGIELAAELPARPAAIEGWVRLTCADETMAQWLLRAITMENVSVRADGTSLFLPASPAFRLEKEIKNVVTVAAKTCHYWIGHTPHRQQRAVAALFAALDEHAPLVAPAFPPVADPQVEARLATATGLQPAARRYAGWAGVTCASVRGAIWIMRALVGSNVLARREETALFVPVNPSDDPDGTIVTTQTARMLRLAGVRGVV